MAILRGEEGSVQFDAAGTTNATIVGTRSWTLNITKDTLDVTDHGDTFRSFVGSLVSGSGTVELVYDPDATGQAAFIEDVINTGDTLTPPSSCSPPAAPPAPTPSALLESSPAWTSPPPWAIWWLPPATS